MTLSTASVSANLGSVIWDLDPVQTLIGGFMYASVCPLIHLHNYDYYSDYCCQYYSYYGDPH